MTYSVDAINTKGEHICLKKTNEDEFRLVLSKIEEMTVAIGHTIKCQMVRQNVRDCLEYINQLSLGGEKSDKFIGINRLFENAVNSFYSWTQFTEVHFIKSFFGKMRCDLYDNNEDYRYTLALRICSTHKVLPINNIVFRLDEESKAIIEVEPQFLLDYGDIPTTKKIYTELIDKQARGEKIDLIHLIIGLDMDMPCYERMILNEIQKSINPWLEQFTKEWTEDFNFVVIHDENGNHVTHNLIGTVNRYFEALRPFSLEKRQ